MRVHYLRLALLVALYTTHSAAVSLGQDEPTEHRLLRVEAPGAADADNNGNQEGIEGDTSEERGGGPFEGIGTGTKNILNRFLPKSTKQPMLEEAAAKKIIAFDELWTRHKTAVKQPQSIEQWKKSFPNWEDFKSRHNEEYLNEIQALELAKANWRMKVDKVSANFMREVVSSSRKTETAGAMGKKPRGSIWRINGMRQKEVKRLAEKGELDLVSLQIAGVPVEKLARALNIDQSDVKTKNLHEKTRTEDIYAQATKGLVRSSEQISKDARLRTFLEYERMVAMANYRRSVDLAKKRLALVR